MQQLIKGKGKAKTGLRQIDHRVKHRLGQSKQRDPCEQGHRQGMGRGMTPQPPAPVQSAIPAKNRLQRHAIRLEREITDEVRQHQQDQQIQKGGRD